MKYRHFDENSKISEASTDWQRAQPSHLGRFGLGFPPKSVPDGLFFKVWISFVPRSQETKTTQDVKKSRFTLLQYISYVYNIHRPFFAT